MREIGAMWQTGFPIRKPRTCLIQNGSFLAFWHYKNKERVLRDFDVNCIFLVLVLTPPESGFPLEFTAAKGPEGSWIETQEILQNGHNVHGF